MIGRTPGNTLDTEVVATLKYLSKFCRSFDLPLIKWEIELDLPRSKICIICEILNDKIKPLENIKQGFERTISWKKHRFRLYD